MKRYVENEIIKVVKSRMNNNTISDIDLFLLIEEFGFYDTEYTTLIINDNKLENAKHESVEKIEDDYLTSYSIVIDVVNVLDGLVKENNGIYIDVE